MSNSDQEEVGYGKPPREHRFSADHQPRRRRGKTLKFKQSDDMLRNIADALAAEVPVSLNGKSGKAKLGHAFATQLVNQSVTSSFADKIKFVRFLTSSGIIDFVKCQEELREEYKKQTIKNNEKYASILELSSAILEHLYLMAEWNVHASSAFLTGETQCTCSAVDHDSETVNSIRFMHDQCVEILEDRAQAKAHSRERGWHPGSRDQRESLAPAPADAMGDEPRPAGPIEADHGIPPGLDGGDLATGMIGND